jgi:hypothetical protein
VVEDYLELRITSTNNKKETTSRRKADFEAEHAICCLILDYKEKKKK